MCAGLPIVAANRADASSQKERWRHQSRSRLPRTKDRYREHYEINDPVENIRRVIHKLKRFLNSGADLARDRDHERGRADEDDRVDRRFVTRMQTREPIR